MEPATTDCRDAAAAALATAILIGSAGLRDNLEIPLACAGANPNDPIAVRDPVLTRGRSVLASPHVWAVATERRNAVMMLLAHGARTDGDIDKAASCLADELGNADLAALLRKYGNALPRDRCPAPRDPTAPLLSLIGVTD